MFDQETMSPSESLLTTVGPLQVELDACVKSLGGRPQNGLNDVFKRYCAVHINRAADGFLCLRGEGREFAARMLVRPAMEAMFKLLAVRKEPSLLYRIARYEHEQDEKWARPVAPAGSDHEEAFMRKWDDFTEAYKKAYPDHALTPSPIDLRSLCLKAEVEGYYDSHYRLYCQYTHAALRASTDGLETFSGEDERVIGFAIVTALEATIECGGDSDGFNDLRAKFLAQIDEVEQDGAGQAPLRSESK